MIQVALARLFGPILAKVALLGLILVGAQLAGFPVLDLATDTLSSFGVDLPSLL